MQKNQHTPTDQNYGKSLIEELLLLFKEGSSFDDRKNDPHKHQNENETDNNINWKVISRSVLRGV